jgi:hypothetical protein
MSLVPFFIPNSSPILSYSPCVDCGGQGESWQSAYTPRPDGFDQTFHQTTAEGHTVSFNLTCMFLSLLYGALKQERRIRGQREGEEKENRDRTLTLSEWFRSDSRYRLS